MSSAITDLWKYTLRLSCGCEIDFGQLGEAWSRKLTPRRKDGTFGATRCPNGHGRRRVVTAISTRTGVA